MVSTLDICLFTLNYSLFFLIGAVGITLWMHGALSVGSIAVAGGLALRLNGMSTWVMWEIGGLSENIGTVTDGMTMMTRPVAVQDRPDCEELEVTRGEIAFDRVSFGYHQDEVKKPHILHDLSLNIRPGEKIGARILHALNAIGLLRSQRPLPVAELARALLVAALDPQDGVKTYSPADIRQHLQENP